MSRVTIKMLIPFLPTHDTLQLASMFKVRESEIYNTIARHKGETIPSSERRSK